MIGTRTSSSYTPHVDVAPADRPLILVAPRWEEAKPFLTEMLSPNEEIASVFVDAILAAGGLPLQMSITEDIEVIRHYVDIADGIAIPGGPDVNPKRWGDDRPYDPTLCCEIRDSFGRKLATDGVPECIEVEGQPFCLGVQWHYTWRLNNKLHRGSRLSGRAVKQARERTVSVDPPDGRCATTWPGHTAQKGRHRGEEDRHMISSD